LLNNQLIIPCFRHLLTKIEGFYANSYLTANNSTHYNIEASDSNIVIGNNNNFNDNKKISINEKSNETILTKIFIGVLIGVLVAVISPFILKQTGISKDGKRILQSSDVNSNKIPDNKDIVILESSLTKTYPYLIIGRIKNNSCNAYSFINIDINLYDKSGNQLGNTLAVTTNLEPKSIWAFKAPVNEENVKFYKIIKVKSIKAKSLPGY
jgi:hypothetical protein